MFMLNTIYLLPLCFISNLLSNGIVFVLKGLNAGEYYDKRPGARMN